MILMSPWKDGFITPHQKWLYGVSLISGKVLHTITNMGSWFWGHPKKMGELPHIKNNDNTVSGGDLGCAHDMGWFHPLLVPWILIKWWIYWQLAKSMTWKVDVTLFVSYISQLGSRLKAAGGLTRCCRCGSRSHWFCSEIQFCCLKCI